MPISKNALNIALATLLLVTLWLLYATPRPFTGAHPEGAWRQPPLIDTSQLVPIAPQTWHFDFEPVAHLIGDIALHANGELVLNANTAKALQQAIATLSPELSKAELQRLAFLTKKEREGKAGEQLADLLLRFYQFRDAEASTARLKTDAKDAATLLARHQHSMALKQEIFGNTLALHLFGRRDALTQYLLSRRQINENPKLDAPQKQQALHDLQVQFEQQQREHATLTLQNTKADTRIREPQ